MKKNLKFLSKLSLILIILFSFFNTTTFADTLDFPSPTNYKYINDYYGLLDEESKQSIVSIGKELEDKTGAEATIVIIDTIGDRNTIEDYSNKLFRTWGIGEKNKDNGLLILLAIDDRSYRVEVGRGLEGAIPDLLSHKVMENIAKPYFQNNDYATGLINSYSNFADLIAEEYGTTLDKSLTSNYYVPDQSYNNSSSGNTIPMLFIIIAVVLDLILNRGRITRFILRSIIFSSRRGGGGRGGFGGGSSGGGFGGFSGGSSNGGGSSGKW